MFVKTLLICLVIAVTKRSTLAQQYSKVICIKDTPCECYEADKIWIINCTDTSLNTTRIDPGLNNSRTIPFKKITFENSLLTKIYRDDQDALHPKHVETLNFAKNRITEIENHAFDQMRFLKVLILSNNYLTKINQGWFNGLDTSLEHLDLSYNNISSIPDEAFKLFKLTYLNLDFNPLLTITDSSFEGLSFLNYLTMDNNKLTVVDGVEFAHLTRLETISIEYTRIEHLPVFNSSMISLKDVWFNGNNIKAVHTNTFSNVPSIERIYLDRMPYLETIEDCAFCGLLKLNHLVISDSPKVKVINERAFDSRTTLVHQLVTLDFSNNSLTSLSSEMLPWKLIDSIYLAGNQWDCSCAARWMTNPNVKIVDDPKCFSPSTLKNQSIRQQGQPLFAKCPVKASYTTPKLFIAMTIILLIAGTVLVSWYVWSSRRGDGRLSNPFKSTTASKPPYAYKNLAMNPDETAQVHTSDSKRQDHDEDDDAPYPPFDQQKIAKASLV